MERIARKHARKKRGGKLVTIFVRYMLLPCRMSAAEKKKSDDPVDDAQMIDDVFGFIESEDDNEVKKEPSAFKDLPKKRKKSETLMQIPSAPEYNEDTSEYAFPKFAKTFFQGNITHQYSRRVIKHSLLNLSTNGDKAVRFNQKSPVDICIILSHTRLPWLCGSVSCALWGICLNPSTTWGTGTTLR